MVCRIRYAGVWNAVGLLAAVLTPAHVAGAAQIAPLSSSVGAQAAFAGQSTAAPAAREPLRAAAQPDGAAAARGSVQVAVTDPHGDRVPGATIVVTGPHPTTSATSAVTDARGEAVIDGLAPGTYTIQVELSGFETAVLPDVVVDRARVTRAVKLALARVLEDVAVVHDPAQRALVDNFSQTLTPEEIENLPDDPEEMAELLEQIAGPGAVMRIDGFQGGELPPKAQIQEIRFRFDPYSAENHQPGRPRIDVVTRPGMGELRNQVTVGFRDQSLDARNPLALERGDGQTRRVRWSVSGPIVQNRTSFAATVSARDDLDAQTIFAQTPTGPFNSIVDQGDRRFDLDVRVDHALTSAQTLRVQFRRESRWARNLGVGEVDMPERAFERDSFENRVRVSTNGTFAGRLLNELRLQYSWDDAESRSLSTEPTIQVLDAFTAGGAQILGGQRSHELEVANDLQFSLGRRHTVQTGFEVEATRYRTNEQANMSGRFTFASLEDYAAGRPLQFSQRVGDPNASYSRYEAAWYVQNDLRLHRDLLLGVGIRHELQSQIDRSLNLSPRVGIAWTPFGSGSTTVRAAAGIFYDWYDAGTYAQTVLVDGIRQQDVIIRSPSYPDPFADGDVERIPSSRTQAADGLRLPRLTRVSFGLEQQLTGWARLRANVFRETESHRLRALNINAPIDGERPFPELERVTQIESIGRAEEHGFDVSLMMSYMPRRLFGTVSYRYGRAMNDADGSLSLPADILDLASEWGPARNDMRHRLFSFINVQLPRGFSLGLNGRLSSGLPYNITLGDDANGDTVMNDRPEGVGRNSARGDWHRVVDMRLSWGIGSGVGRGGGRGPGGGGRGGPGLVGASSGGGEAQGVVLREPQGGGRPTGFEVYLQAFNVLNTANYTTYSGVMTSPSFGEPMNSMPGRRFELGTRFSF